MVRATCSVLAIAAATPAACGPSVPVLEAGTDVHASPDVTEVSPDVTADAPMDAAMDVATDHPATMDVPRGDVPHDTQPDHPLTTVTVRFQDGVTPTAAYRGTTDAYLAESTPTTNLGTGLYLVVDGDVPVGTQATRTTLIRWDLATIPRGSVVQSASITLTVSTTPASGTTQGFMVYGALRPWTETLVTWNYASPTALWTTPGAAGAGTDRTAATFGTLGPVATGAANVTLNAAGVAQVQQWVDDPTTNDGIVISNPLSGDGLGLVAREGTPVTARPRLTVTYTH